MKRGKQHKEDTKPEWIDTKSLKKPVESSEYGNKNAEHVYFPLTEDETTELHGSNAFTFTLDQILWFKYSTNVKRCTRQNLMLSWIKTSLLRRYNNLKKLSHISRNDERSEIESDSVNDEICQRIVLFYSYLKSQFIICAEKLQKNDVNQNKHSDLYNGYLESVSKDLHILCNALNEFFKTKEELLKVLCGFSNKYPFFHQQEGLFYFFWTILRPQFITDKTCIYMDTMGVGKTFQSILNTSVYRILFGWIPSVELIQNFDITNSNFFFATDHLFFKEDSANKFKMWCSSYYDRVTINRKIKPINERGAISLVDPLIPNLKYKTISELKNNGDNSKIDRVIHRKFDGIKSNHDSSEFINSENEKVINFYNGFLRANQSYLLSKFMEESQKNSSISDDISQFRVPNLDNSQLKHVTAFSANSSTSFYNNSVLISHSIFPDVHSSHNIQDKSSKRNGSHKTIKRHNNEQAMRGEEDPDDGNGNYIFYDEIKAKLKSSLKTELSFEEEIERYPNTEMAASFLKNSTEINIANFATEESDFQNKFETFKDKILKIQSHTKMSFISAIECLFYSKEFMSLARVSDFEPYTFRDFYIKFIRETSQQQQQTQTQNRDDGLTYTADDFLEFREIILKAKVKIWDTFFSPTTMVNKLPPLFIVPGPSVSVWLEEFGKSKDSVSIGLLSNNTLKKQNSKQFLENLKYNSKSNNNLVYLHLGDINQFNRFNPDFCIIHLQGVNSELTVINNRTRHILDLFKTIISHYLEEIANYRDAQQYDNAKNQKIIKQFSWLKRSISMISFVYELKRIERLKKYLESLFEILKNSSGKLDSPFNPDISSNVQKLKNIKESLKKIQALLKGCQYYIDTYSYPGFVLNIFEQTFETDYNTLFNNEDFTSQFSTSELNNIKLELQDVYLEHKKFNSNMPAFARYFMSTNYHMVMDESHIIKNANTIGWKSIVQLPTTFRNFMSGTPFSNDVQSETQGILRLFSSFGPFKFNFDLSNQNLHESEKNAIHFHEYAKKMFTKSNTTTTTTTRFEITDWEKNLLLYDELQKSYPIFTYRRNLPMTFLGDRLSRSTPDDFKWNDFFKFFESTDLFLSCFNSKEHTYYPPAQQETHEGYGTDNGNSSQTMILTDKQRLEQVSRQMFNENIRSHVVDLIGRRVDMSSCWNLSGFPISLLYAHNESRVECSTCGSTAVYDPFQDDDCNEKKYTKTESARTKPNYNMHNEYIIIPDDDDDGDEYNKKQNNRNEVDCSKKEERTTSNALLHLEMKTSAKASKNLLFGEMSFEVICSSKKKTDLASVKRDHLKRTLKAISQDVDKTYKNYKNHFKTTSSVFCKCYGQSLSNVLKPIEPQITETINSMYNAGASADTLWSSSNITKTLAFLIHFVGYQYQQSVGGCLKHNVNLLYYDQLSCPRTKYAVENLRIISNAINGFDYRKMMFYRIIRASVILFLKYLKDANTPKSPLSNNEEEEEERENEIEANIITSQEQMFPLITQQNIASFQRWFFENSGEAIKKVNSAAYSKYLYFAKYFLETQNDPDLQKRYDYLFKSKLTMTTTTTPSVTLYERELDIANSISLEICKQYNTIGENASKRVPSFVLFETKFFWGTSLPPPKIYTCAMSHQEKIAYKYYNYGGSQDKEGKLKQFESLTTSSEVVVSKEDLYKINNLLLQAITNSMFVCTNYLSKIIKSHSQLNRIRDGLEYPSTNQESDLFSPDLCNLFSSLGYRGEDILSPTKGFFNISKMPSKYLMLLWYIINVTNIVDDLKLNRQTSLKKIDEEITEEGDDGYNNSNNNNNGTNDSYVKGNTTPDMLIVFTRGTTYLDHLASFIERFLGLQVSIYAASGSSRCNNRESELIDFKNSKTRIILMSLKCGSNSLNLQVANHVILMDPWWNPQTEEQAKRRISRLGQDKQLYFAVFTIKGAVDDIINYKADSKSGFIKGLFPQSSGLNRADTNSYTFLSFNREDLVANCDTSKTSTTNISNNVKKNTTKTKGGAKKSGTKSGNNNNGDSKKGTSKCKSKKEEELIKMEDCNEDANRFQKNVIFMNKFSKIEEIDAKVVALSHLEKPITVTGTDKDKFLLLETLLQSRRHLNEEEENED